VQHGIAAIQPAAAGLGQRLRGGAGVAGQQVLVGRVQPVAVAFDAAGAAGLRRVGAGGFAVPAFGGQRRGGAAGGLGRGRRRRDGHAGAAGNQGKGQQQESGSQHGRGSRWMKPLR